MYNYRDTLTTFFYFLSPIAAIVPTTVATAVAIRATPTVVYRASIISRDSNMCLYQRIENPVKLVSDLPSLNEKIIIYKIGR